MDSKTMLKTKLPKGMIFENVAKLGRKPNWRMVPAHGSFSADERDAIETTTDGYVRLRKRGFVGGKEKT